ncbi:depupylase/deamidase Dop [Brevibacterium yomogidense]|uniref:depupylase/deamidase Dop n=1 Tax=Brevibacterium yomogidense TaxID=946573 RepID=UPI0018DFF319|nr:depupylase/deamidase Dop [Brevibacterium yomogidense]
MSHDATAVSALRVMGAETEFGISQPGRPGANPMRDSARVVDAYAAPRGLRSAQSFWDFSAETPLADARGFLMHEDDAHISQLTHLPDSMPDAQYLANVVLTNGARLYVDHAHPEYSSPEVLSPRDAVLWDRAGDRVAEECVRTLATGPEPVNLYKNNTDSKGSSYGTHENYLVRRDVDFEELAERLIPFFTTRQILCGAGRVGIGRSGEEPGYQISSRADFFEEQIGLETTLRRPIVNTRDEPHADGALWRRLHVIIGDATLAEPATLVRFGATALVLGLIEEGVCPDIRFADPVSALQTVSHDLTLTAQLPLEDGTTTTAIDVQRVYLDAARTAAGPSPDAATAEVLSEWERFLDSLSRDPMELVADVDWVAKLALLEGYRTREGLAWDSPKLALIDVQYSDVRPEKGLFYRLEAAGRIRRLTTDEQVADAVANAPTDTRAFLRGGAIERFTASVAAASWDSLVLERADGSLVRIALRDPLSFTREHVGGALTDADSADDLVARLSALRPADTAPGQ